MVVEAGAGAVAGSAVRMDMSDAGALEALRRAMLLSGTMAKQRNSCKPDRGGCRGISKGARGAEWFVQVFGFAIFDAGYGPENYTPFAQAFERS